MTTTAAAPPASLLRPQPVGVFTGPAGLLVVPPGEGVGELLATLARGEIPERWPPAAAALAAMLAGDDEAALAALGDDPCDHVNRLVLRPTEEHLAAARAAARGNAELETVVAAAAFAAGLADRPPSVDAAAAEFASLAATVRASDALAAGARSAALPWLEQACALAEGVGPALEGRTLGALAELHHQLEGPTIEVADAYGRAVAALEPTDLGVVRAELQIQRAGVLHELSAAGRRDLLLEAIRLYQSALIALDEHEHAESFAFANMNIGLAMLALPATQSSDQVRLGVAVQSLRAALRVYTQEAHPDEWSSGRLNLANALQYLPSTHREDNLAEAVEIYEELLAVRSPQTDPAAYARVLANQANALAHLGILDHAQGKYEEARRWFGHLQDADALGVIDEQLAAIDAARAAATGEEGAA